MQQHRREKQRQAPVGPRQPWLLFSIISSLFDILIFKKTRRMPETGCAGQVEAKQAVSLATVAVQRADESSLSHFSFLFLFFLPPAPQLWKGGQVLCAKFTLCFFCSRYFCISTGKADLCAPPRLLLFILVRNEHTPSHTLQWVLQWK